MLLKPLQQQNELLSVFCSNVEMLLWEIVPWMKGWFMCGGLCPAQCDNEGTGALRSQHRSQCLWHPAQGHGFSGLCCCPQTVGAGGVKVSGSNFPQNFLAKTKILLWFLIPTKFPMHVGMLEVQMLGGFALKLKGKVKLPFFFFFSAGVLEFYFLPLSALSLPPLWLLVSFGQLFTKTCIKNILHYFVK